MHCHATPEALIALNLLPKIGPIRIRRLIDRFGSARQALAASKDALLRLDGFGEETAGIVHRWQDHVDPAMELREVRERGLSLVPATDPHYPASLREAYDHPVLLYVWGELTPRDRHAIGIVGTRRASHYGQQATRRLSFQFAHAGFTVLSGLARGIDTAAHEAALAAGGRTVAVIGSGLARLFPAENLGLAERIAEGHGAVVSEFPLHTPPDKQTFPQRNRIVAAWSQALLVTESPLRSGSLITAQLAADYGRPVFAVPGPIDRPTSAGCHRLIRDGATLVTDGADLLDDLGSLPFPASSPTPSSPSHPLSVSALLPTSSGTGSAQDFAPPTDSLPLLSPEENALLTTLGSAEFPVDRLTDLTGLPARVVSTTLMKLEMKRLVLALPGFRYSRRQVAANAGSNSA